MDLTPTSNNPAHTKSPESDTDTETPLQTHLSRALSLTNASFQYHPFHHCPPPQMLVSYKECLKNHAATLGGLALDGCGEFMPCPSSTPSDPTSLKCAACGCHRNFHRRDPYSPRSTTPNTLLPPPPAAIHWTSSPSPGQTSSGPSHSPNSPASPTPQQSIYPSAPHMLLALSTGHSGPFDETPTVMNPHGRKRARTKFTEEQKEKMQVFAEKLGWKMVRSNDEKLVEKFCSEVGVKRNVFKVWMHNNKHRKEKGNNNNNSSSNTHNSSSCDIINKISINGTNEGRVEFEKYNNCNRFQIESKIHVHGDSLDGSSPSSS